MKKIMIALAVAVMAVASQGAIVKWSASNVFAGNTTDKYTGTAYLFDAGTLAQSALFDAFVLDRTAVASKAIDNQTVSSTGAIAAKSTTYGDAGVNYNYYFAIVDGDNLYLSNIKNVTMNTSDTVATPTAFGTQNSTTAGTFSTIAPAEGFQGAGHWSQAIPEPTSALMLLVGLAGLALKRKVA